VERHRQDQVAIVDQLAAGPGQPFAEGRRAVGAVAVLEAEQQATGDLVVPSKFPYRSQ
jgi:hypothetical protein